MSFKAWDIELLSDELDSHSNVSTLFQWLTGIVHEVQLNSVDIMYVTQMLFGMWMAT